MNMPIRSLLGVAVLVNLLACSGPSARQPASVVAVKDSVSAKPVVLPRPWSAADTTLTIGGVGVGVHLPPDSLTATVLVLPGWNFAAARWCAETRLCQLADSLGLALIQPEMGKSIYASQYYPETRADYRRFLTRGWVIDSLRPFVQDTLGLLRAGQPNYLLGLSTGARGVALIALDTDSLFRAGIALSGDYDQRLLPADNLMRNTYGTLAAHPERWSGADNPTARAHALHVPLYLGHGQADKVVPWQQTQLFYDSLRVQQPGRDTLVLIPTAAHDFAYWGSQLEPAFNWALGLRN